MNYKTQPGLIAALKRASFKPMSVKLAWWFRQAEYALVNNFGWNEESAATLVASHHPRISVYRATD